MLFGFYQTGHWKYIKLKINKQYVKIASDVRTIKNVDQCYALMYYYQHTVLFFELQVNNAESL